MRPASQGHLLSLVRKELIRPERSTRPRGRGVPLPAPPDPRRRVRLAAQGDAGRAARAVRRLARGSRRAGRAGRDRRLPPRAGAPQPRRAGPVRPASRRARRAGRGHALSGRPQGVRAAASSRLPLGLLERSVGLLPDARPATIRRPDRSRRSAVPDRQDRGRARRCRRARRFRRPAVPAPTAACSGARSTSTPAATSGRPPRPRIDAARSGPFSSSRTSSGLPTPSSCRPDQLDGLRAEETRSAADPGLTTLSAAGADHLRSS